MRNVYLVSSSHYSTRIIAKIECTNHAGTKRYEWFLKHGLRLRADIKVTRMNERVSNR